MDQTILGVNFDAVESINVKPTVPKTLFRHWEETGTTKTELVWDMIKLYFFIFLFFSSLYSFIVMDFWMMLSYNKLLDANIVTELDMRKIIVMLLILMNILEIRIIIQIDASSIRLLRERKLILDELLLVIGLELPKKFTDHTTGYVREY